MQALQIAGGVIESIAASKASQEMKDATIRELRLQNKYRGQAFSELGQSLPQQGAEAARESVKENAGERNQAYESANSANFGQGSTGPGERDQQAIAMAAGNRANLGAYSDWQLGQMIKRIRLQEKLNKISSFSGGDAQIFPSKLSDAQHSQDELGAFGAFLGSVGGAGSSYAAYAKDGRTEQANNYNMNYSAPPNQGYDYNPDNSNTNYGQYS